jgi:hypothetical protein
LKPEIVTIAATLKYHLLVLLKFIVHVEGLVLFMEITKYIIQLSGLQKVQY